MLIVLELLDKVDSPLQDLALVPLAVGNNLGEFVNAFVDCLAATTLDCG
jgi:hypothetical protein